MSAHVRVKWVSWGWCVRDAQRACVYKLSIREVAMLCRASSVMHLFVCMIFDATLDVDAIYIRY